MNHNTISLPSSVAKNQEEFKRLFTHVRNNDWNNCQGFAYLHIAVRDLDELILSTPNMKSAEIVDMKVRLTNMIRDVYECSVDKACTILNNAYIPTQEEYDYLCKKEFGDGKDASGPYEPGVYDSVSTEESGWFNFCLNKWNMFHNEHEIIDETNRVCSGQLKKYAQQIKDEWDALTPEQQIEWRRV